MSAATMNIKDPEVRERAAELARMRGVSMTEAIRQALDEAVERDRAGRARMVERLLEIGRSASERAASDGYVWPTDDDLYDAAGLPK